MTTRCKLYALALSAAIVAWCGEDDTAANSATPAAPAGAKTRLLESGTDLMQEMQPVDALNVDVDGFDFVNDNMRVQVESPLARVSPGDRTSDSLVRAQPFLEFPGP